MNRILASRISDQIGTATILDARSPSEFVAGHIPGALSLPLFDDDQRAEIGTLYKQTGSEEATLKGLEIAGLKMRQLVERAQELAPDRKAILHCWRGGQRSGALGWLLSFAGFDIQVVEGGYKSYRQQVHQTLTNPELPLLVLGGKTGAGKTELLAGLANAGEQVIDLEGLANHKGSAFGWIGEEPQPTTEQFENQLALEINKLDLNRRIWIENESRGIGHVYLPVEFMTILTSSPLFNVVVEQNERLKRLADMYSTNSADLKSAFERIEKKLGGQHLKEALEYVEQGQLERAAEIALTYYDKTYQYGLDNTSSSLVIPIDLSGLSLSQKVGELIRAADKIQNVSASS